MTVDELMGMAEADPGLMDDLVHQLDQQSDPAIARCLAGREGNTTSAPPKRSKEASPHGARPRAMPLCAQNCAFAPKIGRGLPLRGPMCFHAFFVIISFSGLSIGLGGFLLI